jgi:hypothetical protein
MARPALPDINTHLRTGPSNQTTSAALIVSLLFEHRHRQGFNVELRVACTGSLLSGAVTLCWLTSITQPLPNTSSSTKCACMPGGVLL